MKIYISTDLEGISGVYRFAQTREYGTPENIEARHLLMGEVNAAVAGAFDGGATRVVVRDGHNGAISFFPEELDERAEMVMGRFSPFTKVMQKGFDAAILLGFHAMSNTEGGILCHTQSSKTWDNYWINDELAGEIRQSSTILGAYGVPVVMVTGDDKTVKEAKDLLGNQIVTVQVKEGLSREGALMLSPKKARAIIREGAKEAMKTIPEAKPYIQEFPAKIKWQFLSSEIVKNYKGDANRLDDRTLEKIVDRAENIISP